MKKVVFLGIVLLLIVGAMFFYFIKAEKTITKKIERSKSPKMKTVNFQDGIVRFSIPENWVENYSADGWGEFYLDAPDSGVLRLYVTTIKKPKGSNNDELSLINILKKEVPNSAIRQVNDNVAIAQFDEGSIDRGDVRYWVVVHSVSPDRIRIANFSYTLLESQFNDPSFVEELSMINREIEKCQFSKRLINNRLINFYTKKRGYLKAIVIQTTLKIGSMQSR